MKISSKFSQRLESAVFVSETVEAPKIKGGGSSSSTVLNRYHDALAKEMAGLTLLTNEHASRSTRVADMAQAQAAATSGLFDSLSTRVDVLASGSPLVLADLFGSRYVSSAVGETTVEVNELFGQATLPIKGETDLLVQQDSKGDLVASSEVSLYYTYESSPTADKLIKSPEGMGMLLRRQAWLGKEARPVWIVLEAPLQYLGLSPNVLEIYPLPAFGMDVSSLSVELVDGGWTSVDCSYLPRYTNAGAYAGLNYIQRAGPLRIHLPGSPVTRIRFRLHPLSGAPWGLYDLRVKAVEYEQSGSLTVLDPYGRAISEVTIRGKDPTTLANLVTDATSNKVRIELSSTTTKSSPVITGVVMRI